MPFPLDPSSAFRLPSELLALARAVRDAGEYDETRWIEWKSSLPLAEHHGKVHLIRQILGFANRDPEVAVQWAEGYGYLLIGVSPGEVRGVTPVDPQVLTQDLTPYVGTDVTWSPEYVTLDGATVLIVVIAPPKPGDLIHFLRKDIINPRDNKVSYREGTIFVRRHGEVHVANHDERLMLQRRLRAGGDVLEGLTVSSELPLEITPVTRSRLREAIFQERERLLGARYKPSEPLSHPVIGKVEPDKRTLEEYEAEIDAYLEKLFSCYRDRLESELAEYEESGLMLSIHNGTDRAFLGLQVTVNLRGVSVWVAECKEDISRPMDLPDEPKPLGTPRIQTAFHHISNFTHVRYQYLGSLLGGRSQWEARQTSDGLCLEFEPIDLRPRSTLKLDRVPLWIESEVGARVTIEWRASCISAQGVVRDAFTVETSSPTIRPFASLEGSD